MSMVLGSRASIGGVLGRGGCGAAAPWWMAAGVTPVAAYAAKGAASLAASYVNLANPGTYDAAPGVAPTWDAATGWTFGSGAYLTTALVPSMDTTWTALVRFDYTGGGNYPTVLGLRNSISGGQVQDFLIAAGHALGRIANGQLTIVQPVLDDGFFRIVPGRDYLADDGMAFTFTKTAWPTLPDGTKVKFIFGAETLDGERTGDQTVRLEVTAAQGTALAAARAGRQHYDMVATLPSGSVVGLAENAPVLVG